MSASYAKHFVDRILGKASAGEPNPVELAYRHGWQDGVFQVLDLVQARLADIRARAVASDEAWRKDPRSSEYVDAADAAGNPLMDAQQFRGDDGKPCERLVPRKVLRPNPDPAAQARYEMNLDELRAMIEEVLRHPGPRRRP